MPVMRWRVKKSDQKSPADTNVSAGVGRGSPGSRTEIKPAAHADSMGMCIQLQPMGRNTEQISTLMLGGRGCKSTMSEFDSEKEG